MNVSALLTSAGINIGISAGLLSLYSVLRKQPGNASVYFGRQLAQERKQTLDPLSLERFVPSPSWMIEALKTSEEEILASCGLDAVAFIRIIVFRLWVHCLALYIISFSACILLYFEYKRITKMRLIHITRSAPNPRHFTVLVRSIPWSVEESLSCTVKCFFTKYHASSYLAHQMIYRVGKLHTLMTGAEKVYKELRQKTSLVNQSCKPLKYRCGLCGGAPDMQYYQKEFDLSVKRNNVSFSDPKLKVLLVLRYMSQIVTGYLPSVILLLFLYTVPPTMMLFSALEGPISRSMRKRSACYKVVLFNIWNVFFVNVLSGSIIHQINTISTPKQIPTELAKAVPSQATFFITYVLTSGWASLSTELIQLFALVWNLVRKIVLRKKDDPTFVPSFPYHTEVPRVLLLGLFGFTCAILAPLILPFLLVYFLLGYVVYRNQLWVFSE